MTETLWQLGGRGIVAEQRDRDAVTLMAVPFVAGFVTVGYLIIALGHLFLLPPHLGLPLLAMAGASCMTGSMVLGFWRLGWIGVRQANLMVTLFSMIVIANSGLHIYLTGEPHQAVNIGLAVMCLGLFHLSVRHILFSFAVMLAVWLTIAVPTFGPNDLGHYGFFVFNTGIVTVIAFMIRWKAYDRLIIMNKEASAREVALEEALTRARLAEQSEQDAHAKNEFLANMSHELRTPLNAVIGFSEVLKEEMFGPLGKEEYRQYVADINAAGTKLLEIVNDILDLATMSRDGMEIDEDVFDLDNLMGRCVQLAEARRGRKHVDVTYSVSEQVRTVHCDERRIKQMVMNLLSNAIKFTPDGGNVHVKADVDDRRGVLICVTDTGVGMDDVQISKALNPFWQAESSLNRTHEGLGLGLPLTKEFARRFGGDLDIKSAPGIGTRATIWLPMTVLPQFHQPAASQAS